MPSFISPKALKRAMLKSEERLKPFRDQRLEFVKAFRGRFYGNNEYHAQPINLINRQMTVLAAHLTAGNPINDVRTDRLEYRAKALLLQLALGHLDQQIDRAGISRRMLMESFVSPCMFARVGIRAGVELVTIEGKGYDRGQPYYMPISLDDMVYDPAARCDAEALFMGHRYRINRQRALESGVFEGYEDSIRGLRPLSDGMGEALSDETTESRRDPDSYAGGDIIELADVAIYDDDMVYMATVPWGEDAPDEYFHFDLWDGPERGPFVKREFTPGIDSPFGVPPVAQAREQAEMVNATLTKAHEQILALKTIMAYKPGCDDTAKAIDEAPDGGKVKVEDPKNEVNILGINTVTPGLGDHAAMVLNLWNDQVNGIQMLGGTAGTGDKTATEYAGQSSSAGLMVGDLAREHERFETEVTKRLAFYLRTDPFIKLPLVHRIRGGELMQVNYTPDMIEDDHGDFTYKIRSLSMRAETQDPIIRQRRLIELLGAFAQVAQVSAATGNLIDFGGSVRVLAREFGIEEVDEIIGDPAFAAMQRAIYSQVPGEEMGQPGAPSGGMKPNGRTSNKQTTASGSLAGTIGRSIPSPAA